MTTLYRFKSEDAKKCFTNSNRFYDHNPEMAAVLEVAGVFELVPSGSGYYANKDGKELRTDNERVYITDTEFQFFEKASSSDIKMLEIAEQEKIEAEKSKTPIGQFEKAVSTVESILELSVRDKAILKLVRYELERQNNE